MRFWFLLLSLLLACAVVCAVGGGTAATADPGGQIQPRGVWPLASRPAVLSGFDPPDRQWGAGHRGVDLDGSAGQAVRAARSGTVTFAGPLAGRGVVVVGHGDGTRTTYEPVAASVAVGAEVGAGDELGRLSLRGSHCLPSTCLHWGWLRGEEYLNPLDLVGTRQVRLLPLAGLAVPAAPPVTAAPPGAALGSALRRVDELGDRPSGAAQW